MDLHSYFKPFKHSLAGRLTHLHFEVEQCPVYVVWLNAACFSAVCHVHAILNAVVNTSHMYSPPFGWAVIQ
jgi:hypothetical protein